MDLKTRKNNFHKQLMKNRSHNYRQCQVLKSEIFLKKVLKKHLTNILETIFLL